LVFQSAPGTPTTGEWLIQGRAMFKLVATMVTWGEKKTWLLFPPVEGLFTLFHVDGKAKPCREPLASLLHDTAIMERLLEKVRPLP
jgi:hypothetical protein